MNYNLIYNRRLPTGESVEGDSSSMPIKWANGFSNEMLQKVLKEPSGGTTSAAGGSSVNPAIFKALVGMLSGGVAL